MKKLAVAVLSAVVSVSTFGYWNSVYWQTATEGGASSYSGSFTNAAHWNVARVPGQDPATADGAFGPAPGRSAGSAEVRDVSRLRREGIFRAPGHGSLLATVPKVTKRTV